MVIKVVLLLGIKLVCHLITSIHKSSVVPCCDDDFCISLFMITLNDSVLLRLGAQVPEDIGAIEVHYYHYNFEIPIQQCTVL